MAHPRLSAAAALAALALVVHPFAASAQEKSSPGWFVPHPHQARPVAPVRPTPGARPAGAEGTTPLAGPPVPQKLEVQLPPVPKVPSLPKASPPPAAIIGILSVPDVLRISTAYKDADKVLGERRQKLNEEVRKEQVKLRDMGQKLNSERAKMSPEQIRRHERELEDRIAESRRKFGEQGRIIQEAGQYVMAQIDRAMEEVAQQVAVARGINIVLNRAQVLGTTGDFDLTPEVAKVLNKILPKVDIPPPGVSPVKLHPAKPENAKKDEHSGKSEKKH